jgi:GTP diphosphokinase / guanosine-3',5'-bis(diphosphate) 3'-diphosphatase
MSDPLNEKQNIRQVYRELLKICAIGASKHDLVKLRGAFELMLECHQESVPDTGENDVFHSVQVAGIVSDELNLGITSVVCALLHNVRGDHPDFKARIANEFGPDVALIIDGFAKLSEIKTEKVSLHSDKFRQLYLSLIKDIRVILIKLAHRLNDMRNFRTLAEEKRSRFLREVQFIYIPIAHRLGLYAMKTELEDLWMKHSHSAVYRSIERQIKESRLKQNAFIAEFVKPLERELTRQGFDFEMKGRPKSIHSIWQKMKKQNVGFDEVYDLFAVRIILNSSGKNEKADCWKVYSIVTDIYQPNPKRLRDWISTPKPSGYESLHATVVGPNGKWVEIQIRTTRMDELAEKGLASHWRYKEGASGKEHEEWLHKIRDFIANIDMEMLEGNDISKVELYSQQTFIFTPEGDLRKLPQGATVLDFAYDIHTSLGDLCSGARVNGKQVPIRHILQNGDKVEILTSKNQKPKLDWLNFVITNKAKNKIKRALKEERFQEAEIGKDILKRKLRNRKIQFSDTIVDKLIKQFKLKSSVDLYYLIAVEKIDLNEIKKSIEEVPETVVKVVTPVAGKETDSEARQTVSDTKDFMVIDDDIENLDYELAKCCHPVSGDAVFGFVTVGKGITIHRLNCPNARQLLSKFNYRVISVKWRKSDENKTYLSTLHIVGDDEVGVLNSITSVISNDLKVNIVSLNVDTSKEGKFDAWIKVSVKDSRHIETLIHKVMKVKGVRKATRSIDAE